MQSDAVRELVVAAERAIFILRVGGYKRSACKCAATRLDHALDAVKAEDVMLNTHIHQAKYVDGKLVRECNLCGEDLMHEYHTRLPQPAVKADMENATHRSARKQASDG